MDHPSKKAAAHEPTPIHVPASKKPSKAWMIVAIVAIVALVGLGIYGYMSMKNLNKKISDQQAQINDLSNKKKALEDAAAAAAKAATDAAAKAVGSALTSSDSDKNQIISSSDSYCVGAKKLDCKPTISKQLTLYADVMLQDKSHLLLIKSSNNTWPVILSTVDAGSLCEVGLDGPAVAAINALCNR